MEKQTLASLLLGLTGNLISQNLEEEANLRSIRKELANALPAGMDIDLPGPLFHIERMDSLEGESECNAELIRELESLETSAKSRSLEAKGETFRVFRRVSPVRNINIPGSVPAWGEGAEIAFTRGPFLGANGLWYWFDFFRITRMVAVFLGNQPTPALLLPLKISIFTIPRDDYAIGKGSIWIRSDLFTAGPAPNLYSGLKVKSGKISFSQDTQVVDNQIHLPINTQIDLGLELDSPKDTSTYSGSSGTDARKATVDLPESCELQITNGGLDILKLDDGSWNLYADKRKFSWSKGAVSWSPLLTRIIVSCETEPGEISIEEGHTQSEVIAFTGQAKILQGAWLLPVAAIDISQTPDAAGVGAWGIETDEGIQSRWLGLEDGEINLNKTWFSLEPGQLSVVAPKAENIYARQIYDLWSNETTGYFSQAKLQYTQEFPFRYQSLSVGTEAILVVADTEINADRPVRVNGRPFEVKGKDTFFLLYDLAETRRILLFDPNILIDNLPQQPNPSVIFESHAIALNNVLLTVSQPTGYFLTGTLDTATSLALGNLNLLHGLFRFLPTLPDPYAANLGRLLREQHREKVRVEFSASSLIANVLATINWPSADSTEENPESATVSYQFLPILNQPRTGIGLDQGATLVARTESSPQDNENTITQSSTFLKKDDVFDPEKFQGPWRELVSRFGADIFALLDVSTNADLLGVTYGWQDEQYIYEVTHKPLPTGASVPFQIEGMDLKASGKFAKAFTVPLVSWEPVINLSDNVVFPADPPPGFLGFPNDGGPTRIFNTSLKTVTLAPIPLSDFIVNEFQGDNEPLTFSIFTLPFGMQALAQFEKENPFPDTNPGEPGSMLEFNRPDFDPELKGGIQFKATGAYNPNEDNYIFRGNTIQLTNLISSSPQATSILGQSVTNIFNGEFSAGGTDILAKRGVPVERIDMSGYGSNMFSNWLNDKAKFAQTSQAKFDVILGRTAQEIIQVRSVIYPYGIGVVRTIVLYRPASGFVYRVDSGWRADSDGLFDFNVNIESAMSGGLNTSQFAAITDFVEEGKNKKALTPYEFHPGIINGVYNVKNIEETTDFEPYAVDQFQAAGEIFLNEDGKIDVVSGVEVGKTRDIKLVPVYFTADIDIDFVKEGKVKGRVPSKKMVGHIQLAPTGTPIPQTDLVNLLNSNPAIGGEIDCVIDIGNSGQLMRLKRVEFDTSLNGNNDPLFVGTPKGTSVLPADGAWSLVQHAENTGEVTPVTDVNGLPVTRQGKWIIDPVTGNGSIPAFSALLKIENARELIKGKDSQTISFAFLQNTGTQKVLYRQPNFKEGEKLLRSEKPDFADAYHLLNSKGIFPNLNDIADSLDLDGNNVDIEIIEKGYQLVDRGVGVLQAPFQHALAQNPWYWVGTAGGDEPVKIYIEYNLEDKDNNVTSGLLDFELDSMAKKWTSDLNATSLVVDLGPFQRLFIIRGNFEAKKGLAPGINAPVMEFGPDLKPIADVLQLLAQISKFPNLDYAELLKKGLQIAMSNTPETWEYKFSAKKEIPVLRFPPASLDTPISPLRIEASLAVGCYFNESLSLTTDLNQLIPSAGAFVEFYGQLSVMCVSIAAATVYAVGQTRVKIYADLEEGPGIDMEYGFGVTLAVGLPVIGTVSLTYMVGIKVQLDSSSLRIDAFLLFKGRAEILGGIVTVTIMIEARGAIERQSGSGRTDMIAQVTFGLEISIFLVINLEFEESWEEKRQLA